MTDTRDATQIGVRASAALSDSGRQWHVLASVSGAIYIESDSEELLWISANLVAMHRRAIMLRSMPVGRLTAGTQCFVEAGCLRIGDKLSIRLRNAVVWRPQPSIRVGPCAVESPRRILDAIERTARRSTPRGCFASIAYPSLADDAAGFSEVMAAKLEAIATPAIASLSRVSSGSGVSAELREAIGLVGLGGGLTPSGDDVLGGFLFTLRTLDSALLGLLGIDWQQIETWLRQIEGLTNKISFAILADHARGEGAASLSVLVNAGLDGSPEERLTQAVGQVSMIGHSSGWDMLVGVRCACMAATRILKGALVCRRASANTDEV